LKLSKFSYNSRFPEIEDIALKDLNLLVGKNANGKSTLLAYIRIIAEVLKENAGAAKIWGRTDSFKITSQKSKQKLEYNLDRNLFSEKVFITKEYLKHNDEFKVRRNNVETTIRNINGKPTKIDPPDDKLTIHIRRDKKEYPYFENLIIWAENTYFIDFNATKLEDFSFESEQMKLLERVRRSEDSSMRYNDLVAYYYAQLSTQKRNSIKEAINYIGFHIIEIRIDDYYKNYNYVCPTPLSFSEINEHEFIEDTLLSSGMKRTIYLIIYIEYLIAKKTPSTLLIDDLGEGLDYERSVNLGKYVFQRCKDSNVQLIAASNDNFLLDAIDLEYWTILNRKGNKISAINMESHPEIFEKFNFVGLSNFSLLSSDFLERELRKQELQK